MTFGTVAIVSDEISLSVEMYLHGRGDDLVDDRPAMHVVLGQNVLPDLRVGPVNQIASLGAEHGILVRDVDEFHVILTFLVGDEGEAGISLLAVLSNDQGVILIVLFQKFARVVIAILNR